MRWSVAINLECYGEIRHRLAMAAEAIDLFALDGAGAIVHDAQRQIIIVRRGGAFAKVHLPRDAMAAAQILFLETGEIRS